MDIQIVEKQCRDALKKCQDDDISVRNLAITEMFGPGAQRGLYWNPIHARSALCLIGAIGYQVGGRGAARNLLGITIEELNILEAGFENWKEWAVWASKDPLWILGRKLGQELEERVRKLFEFQ
jgi:hypothetical protein